MLEHQKIFDTMVSHLRRQGKKAAVGTSCQYRTEDGLKCAVGALIPDELYTKEIEGLVASHPNVFSLIPGAGAKNKGFLSSAQRRLHDRNYNDKDGCFDENGFQEFAKDWDLVYTPPA